MSLKSNPLNQIILSSSQSHPQNAPFFQLKVLVQQNMPNSNLSCFLPVSSFSTICNNLTFYQVKVYCIEKTTGNTKEGGQKCQTMYHIYIYTPYLSCYLSKNNNAILQG